MNLTTTQRICLRIIIASVMFHLMRHFAPAPLVEWAWDVDSPMLATIFSNTPTYNWFGIECSRWLPLGIQFVAIIWVLFMYNIYNGFNLTINKFRME